MFQWLLTRALQSKSPRSQGDVSGELIATPTVAWLTPAQQPVPTRCYGRLVTHHYFHITRTTALMRTLNGEQTTGCFKCHSRVAICVYRIRTAKRNTRYVLRRTNDSDPRRILTEKLQNHMSQAADTFTQIIFNCCSTTSVTDDSNNRLII